MTTAIDFANILEQLHDGEDAAARVVFCRYVAALIELARTHLDTWIRAKEDPEDVIQSVYRSFFLRVRDGKLELGDWGQTWHLLVRITLRKCANRRAYYRAECRDVGREIPLDQWERLPGSKWALAAAAPTPEAALLLTEQVQMLLEQFDPPEQQIVVLSLQGHSTVEIGRTLRRAERSVRRVRERVRKLLHRIQDKD
jgi:RNA polymerase sigma-70 factor (ECF subfamily)